jgi:hypothetical protein
MWISELIAIISLYNTNLFLFMYNQDGVFFLCITKKGKATPVEAQRIPGG